MLTLEDLKKLQAMGQIVLYTTPINPEQKFVFVSRGKDCKKNRWKKIKKWLSRNYFCFLEEQAEWFCVVQDNKFIPKE